MKKILSFLFAAIVVFAVASCQNDRLNVVDGGSVQVTMSLGVNDGLATRADNSAADKLVYAVYDANGQIVSEMAAIENAFQGGAHPETGIRGVGPLPHGQGQSVQFFSSHGKTSCSV